MKLLLASQKGFHARRTPHIYPLWRPVKKAAFPSKTRYLGTKTLYLEIKTRYLEIKTLYLGIGPPVKGTQTLYLKSNTPYANSLPSLAIVGRRDLRPRPPFRPSPRVPYCYSCIEK